MTTTRTPLGALVVGLVGFLALLAAFVVLIVTGHEAAANGLFPAVLALLVGAGVVGHGESTRRQQNAKLDTIEHQTNGVLTKRIEDGATKAVRKVMREAGYAIPEPLPTADELPTS